MVSHKSQASWARLYRWTQFCPYTSKCSEDIALPCPHAAIYVNGPKFSFEFLELLKSYGVISKSTTIKNPQANAFVARIHQVMSDAIRTMELHERQFDDTTINAVLQSVAYGLGSTYHSSFVASPSQIIFGRDMILKAFYLTNWKDLQTRRKIQIRHNNIRQNKSHISHEYKISDSVYIRKSRDPLSLKKSILVTPLQYVSQ
jgi:hypothetical protein